MNSLKTPNYSFFKNRPIVVTGAGGHLGSQLTKSLINLGARVSIIVRCSTDLWRLKDFIGQLSVYHADLTNFDRDQMVRAISQADIFFHLAASGVSPNDKDAAKMLEANVGGTLNALNLAKQLSVNRFIYCGSCFEYGAGLHLKEKDIPLPVSEYGASKAAGWMLSNAFGRKYGLPVVSLRPFTLYGPWESSYRMTSQVMGKAQEGKDIELTQGIQQRDYVFIDDAVEAFLNAACLAGIEGETFNVGTGESIAIKDMAALIVQLLFSKSHIHLGIVPERPDEIQMNLADTTKAKSQLQWSSRTRLEDGLQKTIDWMYAYKRTNS